MNSLTFFKKDNSMNFKLFSTMLYLFNILLEDLLVFSYYHLVHHFILQMRHNKEFQSEYILNLYKQLWIHCNILF